MGYRLQDGVLSAGLSKNKEGFRVSSGVYRRLELRLEVSVGWKNEDGVGGSG